jgi:hypoxia up-regulated 1
MRLLMLGGVCLCFAALITQADAKVLGIDFGSENIKVAIVQPGRVPISVVTNEMSRRKSPGAVGFVNGERLLGEEAVGMEGRYPDKIFTKMRELLGQPASNPSAASLLKKYYLPYELVEDPERKTIMYKTKEGELYSVEDLVAMVLHYVKKIGQAYGQSDIRDVVITVPAFFGQGQRAMLLQAADLAGLNVLSLVSEHAAAALQYGIDKEFVNNTQVRVTYVECW